jgi:hypothetical protein
MKLPTSLVLCASLLWPWTLLGQTGAVRQPEGLLHVFLTLKTLNGSSLADGELMQTPRGDQVTTRLVFHFKDGSLHDETSVFSQRQRFRLITHHLVQKGPAFPQPLEMSIDASTGTVTVRFTQDGKQNVESEEIGVIPDLANGLIVTLLKNAQRGVPPATISYVAATPKPRVVKLAITAAGEEPVSTGGRTGKATHYILKVEIGGVSGLLAPLAGKQPPDSHVWILQDEPPAFVKSEQALYVGGPVWRIETVSPVRP